MVFRLNKYVTHLDACSYIGGEGYRVSVEGYGMYAGCYFKKDHWVLKPDCRERCLPSKCVTDAFNIIGEDIKIAEHTHIEK